MNWILLFSSAALETCKNVFSNKFSKDTLKNKADVYKFNMYLYVGAFLMLLFFKGAPVSVYTMVLALAFAAATAGAQHFYVKALNIGSMSFTSFIQGSNLVIPALYGVLFLKEETSVIKIAAIAVLIFSMTLVLDVKKEKLQIKWLAYALMSMILTGLVGVLQTVHQLSEHNAELIGFLRYAFLYSILFNLLLWKIAEREERATFVMKSNSVLLALASGIFIGAVNIINLYLAGVMPKVIFYPVVNGGLIIATLLAAVIFFKEKINMKQCIGIVIGVVAMGIISV